MQGDSAGSNPMFCFQKMEKRKTYNLAMLFCLGHQGYGVALLQYRSIVLGVLLMGRECKDWVDCSVLMGAVVV